MCSVPVSVTLKELGAEVKKLGDKAALFAHPNLPALRVLEAVGYSGVPTVLAVKSSLGPVGWQQHGVSPIQMSTSKPVHDSVNIVLDATGNDAMVEVKKLGAEAAKKSINIQLDDTATVGSLATLLGALSYFEVPGVNLVESDARSDRA